MQASIPPLLHRYALWFDAAPVPASLVAIALAIVALALLRMAMKFFLVFLALLAVLILGSYLFMGEEETGDLLQDGVYEVVDPPEGSDHEAAEGYNFVCVYLWLLTPLSAYTVFKYLCQLLLPSAFDFVNIYTTYTIVHFYPYHVYFVCIYLNLHTSTFLTE